MGQAPAASNCNKEGRGTPFVKVGEFGLKRPTIREWTTDPKKLARHTDVLICVVGATCGKINLGIDCAIGRSAAAIRPKADRLDQRYLWYFMQGKVLEMRNGSQGAAQTVISREMINDVNIPLPPLEDQQRIVAALDEAFTAIATATANAEKNLANARELFDAAFRSFFDPTLDGWREYRLPEISENLDSMRRPVTKSDRIAGDIPYYGASGQVDSVRDFLFDDDLLLVSEDGANLLMRTYPIAFSISGKSWVNNHAHILKFLDQKTQRLVEYYFNSISVAPWVSGMAQPKLNQKALNTIPIPLPLMEKRAELVALLDAISSEIASVSGIYEQKLLALGELKKSFLIKAFTGELTTTALESIAA
jgi:type I restriction enzyme S subunit